MYCDDMELSEGQAVDWCKIMSVLNPKLTPTEKQETFVSQLEGIFTDNNVFDEDVKTDVDAELDQSIARARLNFQKVIPFDQDIHPDRIRFDCLSKVFEAIMTRRLMS